MRLSSVKTNLNNLSNKKLLFFNTSKNNKEFQISDSNMSENQNTKKNKGKRFSLIISRNDKNSLGLKFENSTKINNFNKFKTNTNLNSINNNNNDSLKNLYFRENKKMKTLSKMSSSRNIDKDFSKIVQNSKENKEKEKEKDSNNPFQIEEEDKIFKKLMKKKKKRKKN